MMSTYPFMQVDAFTDYPLGGNPCAILFDTENLDDDTMLAIAREMNLSETSFVRQSDVADVGARYFTPGGEIPLAGHPTIATVFALVETGRVKLTGDCTTIHLELPVGPIPIEVHAERGVVQHIVMSQKKPKFMATYNPADVMSLFGLTVDDALPDAPIQTVSTGTPQLMIPVQNLEVLRKIDFHSTAYAQFRANADFFSTHLFCLQGLTEAGDTFARHFVEPPDLIEDPFTGSATGGMGAYLWHYGLIDQPTFKAEQGHWMFRPGLGTVEVVGPRDDIEAVKVGGSAAIIMRGELTL